MAPLKKIKILQGIRQGKIGGGESYLLSLVENLNHSRFEPVVLSFTDGQMVERLRSLGIQTHVIYTEKPFDLRVWGRVRKLIEEEEIDLVHAHGTRAASNMFWAAKKLKCPFIYTCHAWSFHLDQNWAVKKLRIWGEQFLTTQADVTICGSKSNRETGRRLFKNFDAIIINNAIDPKRFNPYGVYKNIRSELGIAPDEVLVASIARFTLQKQPLKLIAAFADVCKKVLNVTLLMVGDGEQKEQAVKLIKKLMLQDKVMLQPFRQDIPDVLAAVDIFVLPSLWEALPIALLEAMAMGKAVIATNVDGAPEIIEHGQNGLLIDLHELEKNISEALVRLCSDEALRTRLQQAAVESVSAAYNVETLAQKNEEVYLKLMKDRKGE
jgi:glycosyltransferase involved in cell wall biosynthesis